MQLKLISNLLKMQFWTFLLLVIFFSKINCQDQESTNIQNELSEDVVTSEATVSFRLPRKILPKEYFIKILPHEMGKLSYDGKIKISLFVVETTSEIYLHQGFDLALGDESVKVRKNNSATEEEVKIVDVIYTIASQIVSYKVDKELNAGDRVEFSATFSGLFVTNTQGLNHLEYVDTDGIKKRVLSTYFQPSGARLVFPCLDEPDLKAKFTLQVARREGETVLSNMIVNHTISDERLSVTWVEFQKSVPMSTYLLAFVVCQFDRVRRRGGDQQTLVRVWARREELRQSDYVADLAADVLNWYEGYTGVQFPLQKLDLVTLAAYPVSGMENYGLIIAKEVSSTTKEKLTRTMWVSTIVAHEVAHQWAGNLVTPMWWSEFWLSEGIATFLAALALDELRPFLQAMNHLTVETVSLVKRNDISEEGSTLLQPQFNPLINQLRDVYIYYKGAAILKMIESMVGRETFKKGLGGYFSKHKFQSVTQNDFFNVMEQAIDRKNLLPQPLHTIMKNWTEAKSYPIVTVERNSNNQLSVKQIPFRKHYNVRERTLIQPEDLTLWWVPVSLATSSNPDFFTKATQLWIPPSREAVSLKDFVSANDTWVVLNVQQSAYIRVNYDTQTWKAISKQLYANHEVIHMLNRAQLIDDAFQLFHNGHVMAQVPFELISYLSRERSYFPFKSFFDNLKRIELLLREDLAYPLLKKYVLSLVAPLMSESLGDDNVNRKFKNNILSWACAMRHENCVKLAQHQFQDWKKTNDDSVFSEFTSESFLCAAVECSDDVSDWDIVYNRFLAVMNSTSEMKSHLMNALSCTKSPNVILRYFQLIENSSNGLTVTEARDIFNSLVRSHRWADLTWSHLISNMKSLRKRFEHDPVPFVNTNRDLNYLKIIIEAEQKDEHLTKYYNDFLKENEESVKVSTIMIHEVSTWLKSAMST